MTGNYRYMLANLGTGEIYSELNLTNVSAGRAMGATGGGFSADMMLAHLPDSARARAISDTVPGKFTVVILRDGECLGEWIIWKRVRRNNRAPVQLAGAEVISYMDHRVIDQFDFTQIEQFTIAKALFDKAYGGTTSPAGLGKVVAKVGPFTNTGRLRDRHYQRAEAFYGQRLEELSNVIDGFDYYIRTNVDNSGPVPKLVRELMMYYPRAGSDRQIVIESSGVYTSPGNVLEFGTAEDGGTIAAEAYAVGAGDSSAKLIGTANDWSIITAYGYPYLQVSGSWTSVTQQATIDGHAQALLDLHSQSTVPAALIVRLTLDYPSPNAFQLGDRITIVVEPSINYPTGDRYTVRVIGYTIKPPEAGPETLELQVVPEG